MDMLQAETPNNESIIETTEFKKALEDTKEFLKFLEVEFATPEEKESRKVRLVLQSPQMDKSYMLRFEQYYSKQPDEVLRNRIRGFDYIVNNCGKEAKLKPFNQMPAYQQNDSSGWEFWVDPAKHQSDILDFCFVVADLMNVELITEDDVKRSDYLPQF